jgi:hypothetical protein
VLDLSKLAVERVTMWRGTLETASADTIRHASEPRLRGELVTYTPNRAGLYQRRPAATARRHWYVEVDPVRSCPAQREDDAWATTPTSRDRSDPKRNVAVGISVATRHADFHHARPEGADPAKRRFKTFAVNDADEARRA